MTETQKLPDEPGFYQAVPRWDNRPVIVEVRLDGKVNYYGVFKAIHDFFNWRPVSTEKFTQYE